MKSKTKLSGLILLASYLVIWVVAVTVFWVFIVRHSTGAMVYSLTFLWIVLPVTTLVISFLIGRNDYWGKGKWVTSIGFGVMYMLAEYATFSMANNLLFNKNISWTTVSIQIVDVPSSLFTVSKIKQLAERMDAILKD